MTSLSRAFALFEAILTDDSARSIAAIAQDIDVPVAAAHRHVKSLMDEGYLTRSGYTCYTVGARFLRLLHGFDEKQVATMVAAPLLRQLARKLRCVVHIGTLEGGMVTYRFKCGPDADALFTRVGMQLEAYCSGIGKVLLAALPETDREMYLSTGPFPPLTRRTITDVDRLRLELGKVQRDGHAVDDREVADGLQCVAVPVRTGGGCTLAAISASRMIDDSGTHPLDPILARLHEVAARIEELLIGASEPTMTAP